MTEQHRSRPDVPTMGGKGAWKFRDGKPRVTREGLAAVKLSLLELEILTKPNQSGSVAMTRIDGFERPIIEWFDAANNRNIHFERGAPYRESIDPENSIEVKEYDSFRSSVGKVGNGLLLAGLYLNQFPDEAASVMWPLVRDESLVTDPTVQNYAKVVLPTLGLYPYLDSDDVTIYPSEEGQGRGLRQLTVDDLLGEWLRKEKQFTKDDRRKGRSVVLSFLKNFEVGSVDDNVWKHANETGDAIGVLNAGAIIMRRGFSGRSGQGEDPSRALQADILQAQLQGEGAVIMRPYEAIG